MVEFIGSVVIGIAVVLVSLVTLLFVLVYWPEPTLHWNEVEKWAWQYVKELKEKNDNDNNNSNKQKKNALLPLNNMTVVITGPTAGIGKALTKACFRLGAKVIAIGRSPDKLNKMKTEMLSELKSKDSERLILLVADCADLDSIVKATDEIKEKTESVDFFLVNAGLPKQMNLESDSKTKQGFDLVFGGKCCVRSMLLSFL